MTNANTFSLYTQTHILNLYVVLILRRKTRQEKKKVSCTDCSTIQGVSGVDVQKKIWVIGTRIRFQKVVVT